ncbi:MAG: hypothetical protein JW760_13775 [Spirochaetales bacterium]|nr:hypothetical protein [Spirochaetales bacterium]
MKKKMLIILFIIPFIIVLLVLYIPTQRRSEKQPLQPPTDAQILRFDADPDGGFHWPYYLYLPESTQAVGESGESIYLLVFPNNTGEPADDLTVHDRAAREKIEQFWDIPAHLGTPLLVPVFPRPFDLYVHALDRATLRADIPELMRIDLQLIAMMEDAADRLRRQGWKVNDQALIMGFSASGMFANRFTLLHPDRILAAAIGSPGGWPIAPWTHWRGNVLDYPLGINDFEELTGEPFDVESFKAIKQLFYLGDQDDNDAVDQDNLAYLSGLFGSLPIERWPYSEEMFLSMNPETEFYIDPGVGHSISSKMWRYQIQFFAGAMAADRNQGREK